MHFTHVAVQTHSKDSWLLWKISCHLNNPRVYYFTIFTACWFTERRKLLAPRYYIRYSTGVPVCREIIDAW